jgi:hypothetical protein
VQPINCSFLVPWFLFLFLPSAAYHRHVAKGFELKCSFEDFAAADDLLP